jgi:hypothetical protein
LRAALETQAASYDNGIFRGEYQAVAASGMWTYEPIQLYVRVPWFRVVRNGLSYQGIGDVTTAVRLRVLRSDDDGVHAGTMMAVSLPTGDQQHDLGMGHVMLTPGAFFGLRHGDTAAELSLAYARAVVGENGHDHHARGLSPIVSPMNGSEAQAAVSVVQRFDSLFSLTASAFAAVPVAERDGTARALGSAGARIHHLWFEAGFDAALPLTGEPFILRLSTTLAANF